MGEIMAAKAAALFEEILGWPYRLGGDGSGTNRDIDCSGAWVRAYKAHGLSLYHGSNAQYRRYCSETGRITGPGDLQVGMAVYKCKPWSDDQRGHKDYGTAPGNIYHVGCVTSVNPLRIVHATPPVAKVDTKLGNWAYWGRMRAVVYGEVTTEVSVPTAPIQVVAADYLPPGWARVATQSTGLRMRKKPDTSGAPICEIPKGAVVPVLDTVPGWARVNYGIHVGWCCTDYLEMG